MRRDARAAGTAAGRDVRPIGEHAIAELTLNRARVLAILRSSDRPLTAYAIAARLPLARGRQAAPMSAYRALAFLTAHGLAHRIEALNAYVSCRCETAGHAGQFLICERCGRVEELDDEIVGRALESLARRHGFECSGLAEVKGVCDACREVGP